MLRWSQRQSAGKNGKPTIRGRLARAALCGVGGPGRGRRAGTRLLSRAKDTLIQATIEREYLKPTKPPVRRVLEEIGLPCRRCGWSSPTWRTVKARLSLIKQRGSDPALVTKTLGHDSTTNGN
jgi:hypothetical protein